MGLAHWVGLVVAAGLLLYLTVALLKPEWFA
jgi:K+-transporting ATPase KdpF subunit